jgi:transcriptional regulator with XRE-family HTH domain
MDRLPPLAELGALAKRRREAEGLSQKDLAALAGVHHATIVALEKGDGRLRLVNAWAVLNALGLVEVTGQVK